MIYIIITCLRFFLTETSITYKYNAFISLGRIKTALITSNSDTCPIVYFVSTDVTASKWIKFDLQPLFNYSVICTPQLQRGICPRVVARHCNSIRFYYSRVKKKPASIARTFKHDSHSSAKWLPFAVIVWLVMHIEQKRIRHPFIKVTINWKHTTFQNIVIKLWNS